MSSSQNPGTQQNREDQKARPQPGGGQHGQHQDEEQKQGSRKDPSRGNTNPGSDSERSRKPDQKSGQS